MKSSKNKKITWKYGVWDMPFVNPSPDEIISLAEYLWELPDQSKVFERIGEDDDMTEEEAETNTKVIEEYATKNSLLNRQFLNLRLANWLLRIFVAGKLETLRSDKTIELINERMVSTQFPNDKRFAKFPEVEAYMRKLLESTTMVELAKLYWRNAKINPRVPALTVAQVNKTDRFLRKYLEKYGLLVVDISPFIGAFYLVGKYLIGEVEEIFGREGFENYLRVNFSSKADHWRMEEY